MLKIGIFTPYVRNEITLAAVQLADWLYKCGMSVSLLADGQIQKGVHHFWDSRVNNGTETAVYKWAYNATHLLWFSANAKALQQSHLVTFNNKKQKTKNIFVPNWINWDNHSDTFLAQCDKTICLNREFYLWLRKFRSPDKLFVSERFHSCLVTPDSVLIPKAAKRSDGFTRLLVFLPKQFELDISLTVFDTFHKLLNKYRRLKIHFLSERSLTKPYKQRLKKLLKAFSDRTSFQYSLSYGEYSQLAKKADIVYLANTRHAFGSVFNLFAASTTPVVCHTVSPATAFISNRVNGFLVPCTVVEKPYPVADVNLADIEEVLNKAISSTAEELHSLQLSGVALLKQKQNAFERFLYRTLVETDL